MNSELSMDQALIEKLNNILEVNLDKEHFGVKELAKEVGLSSSQLNRKLQSIKGKSTNKFISEFRLNKAMVMLQKNVATASEIAYRVGFSSPTYFNTCFHDYYGYPPGEVKFRNPKTNENNDVSISTKIIDGSQNIIDTTPIKKSLLSKKMVWINTLGILLLSVFCYYLYSNYSNYFSSEIPATAESEKSIAIIPFKNLNEATEDKFITLGVSSSLQSQLNKIKGLKVICERSMEKYADTTMTPSEIAKEVDVTYLLDGTVQKHKDSIRVIIHFINAKDNNQFKSMVFIEEFKNIFALQSTIAKEVADELNIELSQAELEIIDKKPTQNLEAYNLYLKGRFFWHRRTEEGLNKSIEYFNKALELDPDYALAYAGLADSYQIMGGYELIPRDVGYKKGKELAQKALAIDNTLAEAHTTLATILCYMDRNWEDSETEFKLALSLNPNYATGHQFYAELLDKMGRKKEAREQIDLALNLNPNSFMMNFISARYYNNEERFEEALELALRAKEIDKNQRSVRMLLFDIYVGLGEYDLAAPEIEAWYKLGSYYPVKTAKGIKDAYNKSGIEGVFRFMIDVDFKSGYAQKYPLSQAALYGIINDAENSFKWLEMECKGNQYQMINAINGYFWFNNLKNHPKYKNMLEKLELEE